MGNPIAVDLRSADVNAMRAVAPRPRQRNTRFKTKLEEKQTFDMQLLLESAGLRSNVHKFREKVTIFAQGEPAKNVMYIQEGSVKLTVVNETGKEAVVALLGPGDFLGEGCLGGQSICMATATVIAPTAALVLEKNEMIRALHEGHELSDLFIAYMLGRNIRVEEDLIDHLFNSSEKRLARTLLMLARYGKQDQPHKVVAKISQETLAEMIGTTRSRVNFFMNKFRKLGFIQYRGEIHVNNSLLNVILHDSRTKTLRQLSRVGRE